MSVKTVIRILAMGIAGIIFGSSAFAQWQWVDKDGRKVFSDRSPPPEINEKDILKRPAGSVRLAAPDAVAAVKPAVAASSAIPKASAPKLTGKDAELEAKKKQAEDQEAAAKKAEEEKISKAKAENCERVKKAAAGLDSGVRISTTNAKGEREFMDDKTRATESKRLKDNLATDCK